MAAGPLHASDGPALRRSQPPDIRFLEGLLQRRLYLLADTFCKERWADRQLSSDQRVEVAIRWIRTCTLQALDLPEEDRTSWWEKAGTIADDFDQRMPDLPRGLLVRLQFALCQLAQVESSPEVALEEPVSRAASGSADSSSLQRVRDLLRTATRRLQQVEASLSELLVNKYQRRGRGSVSDGWTLQQLESLRRHLVLDLARARRLQAICYPARSDDRTNALDLAIGHLRELAASTGGEPQAWQARIETLVCLRLMGRIDQAQQLLDGWIDRSEPYMKAQLQAEQMRILLAQEERAPDAIQKAFRLADQLLETGAELRTPETDVAILEVLLAAHRHARAADTHRLAELASIQCREIGRHHGPYWQRRAESQLGRALARSTSETQDRALLRYAARSLYLAGKRAESVAAYDRAAALAGQADDRDGQFELAKTAAAVVGESDAGQGADRYRQLALGRKSHPRASEVHLLAIGMTASQIRTAEPDGRAAALEQYRTMLWEHLQGWPRGPRADTARWWLGRLQMRDRQWAEAAATLGQVTAASDHYPEALRAAVDCYRTALQQLEGPGGGNPKDDPGIEDTDPEARQLVAAATKQLLPVIASQDHRWPEVWSPLQRSVALALARMHLRWTDDGHEYAARLLAAALAEPNGAETEWRSRAMALWAAALVGNGQQEQGLQVAREAFQDPKQRTPENVLALADALQFPRGPAGRKNLVDRQGAARLIVAVAELVGPFSLDPPKADPVEVDPAWQAHPEWQAQWAHAQGLAWDLLGDRRRALVAIRRQVALQPDDGDALETLATMLAAEGVAESLGEALSIWNHVERRSKPAGPRWWRAREARLELLKRLGEEAQANKLEQLTRVLYGRESDRVRPLLP